VTDNSFRHLYRFVARMKEPRAEIHVFAVTEEAFVKAAELQKRLAVIKGCRGAGREWAASFGQRAYRPLIMPSKGYAESVEVIPSAIELVGLRFTHLR